MLQIDVSAIRLVNSKHAYPYYDLKISPIGLGQTALKVSL